MMNRILSFVSDWAWVAFIAAAIILYMTSAG